MFEVWGIVPSDVAHSSILPFILISSSERFSVSDARHSTRTPVTESLSANKSYPHDIAPTYRISVEQLRLYSDGCLLSNGDTVIIRETDRNVAICRQLSPLPGGCDTKPSRPGLMDQQSTFSCHCGDWELSIKWDASALDVDGCIWRHVPAMLLEPSDNNVFMATYREHFFLDFSTRWD